MKIRNNFEDILFDKETGKERISCIELDDLLTARESNRIFVVTHRCGDSVYIINWNFEVQECVIKNTTIIHNSVRYAVGDLGLDTDKPVMIYCSEEDLENQVFATRERAECIKEKMENSKLKLSNI